MTRTRIAIIALVVIGVIGFFAAGLGDYLTLEALQAGRAQAVEYVHQNPVLASVAFFAVYVAVTALSLPGAAVMTLAAGAVFGVVWGLILVSFASTLGATLAFLLARTLLHDWVQKRFSDRLGPINRGFERDGEFYLFSLRMVPIFPFFIVNLVMGLTPIRVIPFFWVSQVGMFAGTFVYVFAGTQLAQVHQIGDVMSPGLIVALSLLGVFPLVARKVLTIFNRRRGTHEVG
jgi:uncharacterized membrane protein YdjX (TVP38/TMEM64 family)